MRGDHTRETLSALTVKQKQRQSHIYARDEEQYPDIHVINSSHAPVSRFRPCHADHYKVLVTVAVYYDRVAFANPEIHIYSLHYRLAASILTIYFSYSPTPKTATKLCTLGSKTSTGSDLCRRLLSGSLFRHSVHAHQSVSNRISSASSVSIPRSFACITRYKCSAASVRTYRIVQSVMQL